MREILILGRGGQGAQTAGQLLAKAFFAEGCYVQSYATYGGARRGTPVSAVIRIDERRALLLTCDIQSAGSTAAGSDRAGQSCRGEHRA